MRPIGPLAIVLRHFGGRNARANAALLAVASGLALLGGSILLIA
ncbi:hypothetical protein ACFV4N_28865 [Actinosynnema sp. NPDC059797]